MKTIATWLWCLPQQLAGLILCRLTKARKVGDHYEYDIKSGSISLGEYIFLCPAHKDDATVLKHEQGHMKQSRMLGWLYLLVIGIPSIVWARCFEWYRAAHGISYYDFYTEKWADELGGVRR
jgi:hypothetical protein